MDETGQEFECNVRSTGCVNLVVQCEDCLILLIFKVLKIQWKEKMNFAQFLDLLCIVVIIEVFFGFGIEMMTAEGWSGAV